MSIMLEQGKIKGITTRNRIVRSATYESMATYDGRPKPELAELYYQLADGDIGLIFTSATMIDRYKNIPHIEGFVYPTAIDEDSYIDDWKPIVEGVQSRGAKIAMQIVHPGRQDNPQLRGAPAQVPSAVPIPGMKIDMHEMNVHEIKDMVEKFARAIRRIKEAGFDGVQVHGGHGYLINNFISPYMNVRDDEYGGSTENRARFVLDIVKRSREIVGDDFPIMIKMNCDDFMSGGIDRDEAVNLGKAISVEGGIDCIEVTGGVGVESGLKSSLGGINKPEKEAYFKEYSAALKKALDIPIILVGGMRSPEIIEKALEGGDADFVSMCRPFIREPDLVKRWQSGDLTKATCISCNQCGMNVFRKPLMCYVD